jgi:hypothetical protein
MLMRRPLTRLFGFSPGVFNADVAPFMSTARDLEERQRGFVFKGQATPPVDSSKPEWMVASITN